MIHYIPGKTVKGTAFKEEVWDERFAGKTETVFAQCNGYMGIRASLPVHTLGECRGTFLTGLYHKASAYEVSELINCPDVTETEITLNGEKIFIDRCRVERFSRKLFLHTGELEICLGLVTGKGQRLEISNRRFASRKDRHLFIQELKVKPEQAGQVEIAEGINGQITNSGAAHFAKTEARVFDKKYLYTESLCDDGQRLHVLTGTKASKAPEKQFFYLKRKSIYENMSFYVEEGEALTICKGACFCTDEEEEIPKGKELCTYAAEAFEKDYEELLKEHAACCKELWKYGEVKLHGASLEEQAAVDFAVYHILGMTPDYTDAYSIGAKGLTGEGYKGHVFWDAELFVMPFFTAVFPETARKLLTYRHKGLPGARKKAEQYGCQGAMYPWESAKTGEEETPLFAALNIHTGIANKIWSGIKEHHVTADIIHALREYLLVTGDEGFLKQYGMEMLIETAQFWVSRSVLKDGRQEILDIIGPDEYTEHVDNNAYTNYMAGQNVAFALEEVKRLAEEDREYYEVLDKKYDLKKREAEWKEFLALLYLPEPNIDGIIPQDDTFLQKPEIPNIEKYRNSDVKQSVLLDYSRDEIVAMQVLKQADAVMLLNLKPELFSPEIVKKNVDYYEARTIHDSSLSYCAHAIACARIGEREAAEGFFEKALEIDLNENYKDSVDGIHSASLGGIWNCLIQGFAGVEYQKEGIRITPHLPERFRGIEFFHKVKGRYYRIYVAQDQVEIYPEETGREQKFFVFGKEILADKAVCIHR